jgi:LPS export ABC transporter protein LptC
MIRRIVFAFFALSALGALLFLQQAGNGGEDSASSDLANADAGFVAVHGQLIETGENGHPLYRLDADKIEQPLQDGMIYLTSPRLDYQPDPDNHWTLTALQGELPQDAHVADLTGNVHAEGRPTGSNDLMRIDTALLHLNMPQQQATTASRVRVVWGGRALRGRGMRADIKGNRLELYADVHAFAER